MTTITKRLTVERPLTNLEVDTNFDNLNNDKVDIDGTTVMEASLLTPGVQSSVEVDGLQISNEAGDTLITVGPNNTNDVIITGDLIISSGGENKNVFTYITTTEGMVQQVTTLETEVDNNAAAISQESFVRANADSAIASQITSLSATVGENTAAITTEATARANADTAISQTITTLTATVNNNTAAITTEQLARASADSAISQNVTTVQATVNGKNKTYYQGTAPTQPSEEDAESGIFLLREGDLWIDSDDDNKVYRWDGSVWVVTSDASALNLFLSTTYSDDITSISEQVDKKAETWFQASDPSTAWTTDVLKVQHNGDLWYDTDDKLFYRYERTGVNTGQWLKIEDAAAIAAAQAASNAQAAADGKIVTFAQNDPPTAAAVGDLWFDTNNNNTLYRWNGSNWIEYTDGKIALVDARVTNTEQTKIGYATKQGVVFDNNGSIVDKAGVESWNANNPGDPAVWNVGLPLATAVKAVAIDTESGGSLTVEETFLAQEQTNGDLLGRYGVKIDNNGNVAGFGLNSTPNNGAIVSEFKIAANRFSIGPPTDAADPDESPFYVVTAQYTDPDTGKVITPGVYLKSTTITKLTADQIDTRGLSIKDANGNVVFSSGSILDWSNISTNYPADITNSNITLSGLGAGIWATLPGQLTSSNISTYIASAAIDNAYIANLDAAKINTGFINAARIQAGTISVDKIQSNTSGAYNGGTFALGVGTSIYGYTATSYASQANNGRSALIAEHTSTLSTNQQAVGGVFSTGSRDSPAVIAINKTSATEARVSSALAYGSNGVVATYGVDKNKDGGAVDSGKSSFIGAAENFGAIGSSYGNVNTLYSVPVYQGIIGAKDKGGQFISYNPGTSTSNKLITFATQTYAAVNSSGQGSIYVPDGVGPFTGYHEGLVPEDNVIEVGDIIFDVESYQLIDVSTVIFYMDLTNQNNQKGVVGICCKIHDEPPTNWMTQPNLPTVNENGLVTNLEEQPQQKSSVPIGYKVINVNAVGEGQINVCGLNGNIEKGDLIVASSIPGKGMKQDDDIIRSYTVAKAREAVTFNAPDEVKMIPCFYLCG